MLNCARRINAYMLYARKNMEQIYQNLLNPAWWFTGVFFILLGVLIKWLFGIAPSITRRVYRLSRCKKLRYIKNNRWSSVSVNYEIAKAQSWFIVFFISCVTFLGWLAYEPIQELFSISIVAGLIVSSPIYIFELLWLKQGMKVRELIKYRNKLRITRRCT